MKFPFVRKQSLRKLILADIEMYNDRMYDYWKRLEKAKEDKDQSQIVRLEALCNQTLGSTTALRATLDFL